MTVTELACLLEIAPIDIVKKLMDLVILVNVSFIKTPSLLIFFTRNLFEDFF